MVPLQEEEAAATKEKSGMAEGDDYMFKRNS